MPEEGPLYEAWASVQNRYQRVYRGRNVEHLDWKMNEYRRHAPHAYLVLVDEDGQETKTQVEKKN